MHSIPENQLNSKLTQIPTSERVLIELQKSRFGLTSTNIASIAGVSRKKAVICVEQLFAEGRVEKHVVGHYTLYSIPEESRFSICQLLYYGSLVMIGLAGLWDNFSLWGKERDLVANRQFLPFEENLSINTGESTKDTINRLAKLVACILCKWGYFSQYPTAEILPPCDDSMPNILTIRLKDPGFIPNGAGVHYNILTSLLQQQLTLQAGNTAICRLGQDIQPSDTEVFFEVGLQ